MQPQTDTEGLKPIGVEVTEVLASVPQQLFVFRYERPKYVNPQNEDQGIIVAALPERALPKSMAHESLWLILSSRSSAIIYLCIVRRGLGPEVVFSFRIKR